MDRLHKNLAEAIHTDCGDNPYRCGDDLYRCGYDSYSYGDVIYCMKHYCVHPLDSTDSIISTVDHTFFMCPLCSEI